MRKPRTILLIIELLVIFVVSLTAGYALLGTSARFLVPFAVLTLLGLLTVVILPLGTVFFGAAALIMTLPTLMKANGIEWWLFSQERLSFCPTVGLPAAMTIGLLVISGSLLLGYLQPMQKELRTLERGQADPEQIRSYTHGKLQAVGGAVLASAAFAAVVTAMIAAVRENLGGFFSKWPWVLPAGGLMLLVALASGLFWLVSLRK